MPLVSKIACFFLLFALFFMNTPVQAYTYLGGNPVMVKPLGGTIGTMEEDHGFMEVSNNPASDGIFGITAMGSNALVQSIEIKELNGNQVFFKTYNTQTVSLDVSSLVQGEYILTVTHSVQGLRSFRLSIF